MLNDELKTKVGQLVDDSMKSPCCKEAERQKIEKETEAFLRRKGRVIELRPDPTIAKTSRF